MRLFDCHSHWSTRRGYVFQTEEELINQERIWGTKATFQTEDEMVATFRKNNVRVILDLATTVLYPMSLDQIRALHDYTFDVQRKNEDVIFGHWLSLDPRLGKDAIREFERAVSARPALSDLGSSDRLRAAFPRAIRSGTRFTRPPSTPAFPSSFTPG